MKELILIAAMDLNRVIGNKGKIPWQGKYSEDMKRFKQLTMEHPVVMGRVTYESLRKPLIGRTNIVISSKMPDKDGIFVARNIKEALEKANKIDDESYIIGGQKIYQQTMNLATRMELTIINDVYSGDAFFPRFSEDQWELNERIDNNGYDFLTYKRK